MMGWCVRIDPRRAALALGCLLALASTHCSRGNDRTQADGSTVTIYVAGDERLLSDRGGDAANLVFLTLIRLDENGEPQPRLAERWEHSPDSRTWTFHLRRDVRWHDGVPVTAHDIKFTFTILDQGLVPYTLSRGIESITVLDDFTFTITFTRPTNALWSTGGTFYPKHLLEDLDPREFSSWEFWTHPVGNGPYRYVRHVPKTMIELEANRDYYRGKPKIERVVLKVGPGGASSRLMELLSGNVDAVYALGRIHIPKLGEDPRFRVYYSQGDNCSMGSFGTSGTRFFVTPSCAAP